ncbi:MAG: hypothetical protein AABY13_03405 [Nanoarchaeota archaeon]
MGRRRKNGKAQLETPIQSRRRFSGVAVTGVVGVVVGLGLSASWYRTSRHETHTAPEVRPAVQETVKTYAPLEQLANDKHPSLGHVELHLEGQKPPIIYVPLVHDSMSGNVDEGNAQIVSNTVTTLEHLHQAYGLHHLALEGIDAPSTAKHNAGRATLELSRTQSVGTALRAFNTLFSRHRFTLVSTEDSGEPAHMDIHVAWRQEIISVKDHIGSQGWMKDKAEFLRRRADIEALISTVSEKYGRQMVDYYRSDPDLSKAYAAAVVERDAFALSSLENSLGPRGGILLMGAGHEPDVIRQLRARRRSYIIVAPRGIPRPTPEGSGSMNDFADSLCPELQLIFNVRDGPVYEAISLTVRLPTYAQWRQAKQK